MGQGLAVEGLVKRLHDSSRSASSLNLAAGLCDQMQRSSVSLSCRIWGNDSICFRINSFFEATVSRMN